MRSLFALLVLAAFCSSCATPQPERAVVRVLFVGNSLTYVGNLPAVFDGLAKANGRTTRSAMIAAGGATLTQHALDGSVRRALASSQFEYLVLQERGGDFVGAFGEVPLKQAEESLATFVAMSRRYSITPILLGTYQLNPDASTATVAAESEAAKRLHVSYVPVSDYLQVELATQPDMQWLHPDGAHPGHDLVLLDAVLLYQRIFGVAPGNTAVAVAGPMYMTAFSFAPDMQPVYSSSSAGAFAYAYTVERVARITGALR